MVFQHFHFWSWPNPGSAEACSRAKYWEKTLSELFSTNLQKAIWLHVNLGHRSAISGDLLFIPTENVTSSLFFKSLRKAEGRCSVVVWVGLVFFFSEKGSAGEGRDRAQLKAINKLPTTLTTEVFSFSNKLGPSADQREVERSTVFE